MYSSNTFLITWTLLNFFPASKHSQWLKQTLHLEYLGHHFYTQNCTTNPKLQAFKTVSPNKRVPAVSGIVFPWRHLFIRSTLATPLNTDLTVSIAAGVKKCFMFINNFCTGNTLATNYLLCQIKNWKYGLYQQLSSTNLFFYARIISSTLILWCWINMENKAKLSDQTLQI